MQTFFSLSPFRNEYVLTLKLFAAAINLNTNEYNVNNNSVYKRVSAGSTTRLFIFGELFRLIGAKRYGMVPV